MHWLAVSSVCYNPFVYCWLNVSFRETLRVTCRQCCTFSRRHQSLMSADQLQPVTPAPPSAVRYDRIGTPSSSDQLSASSSDKRQQLDIKFISSITQFRKRQFVSCMPLKLTILN